MDEQPPQESHQTLIQCVYCSNGRPAKVYKTQLSLEQHYRRAHRENIEFRRMSNKRKKEVAIEKGEVDVEVVAPPTKCCCVNPCISDVSMLLFKDMNQRLKQNELKDVNFKHPDESGFIDTMMQYEQFLLEMGFMLESKDDKMIKKMCAELKKRTPEQIQIIRNYLNNSWEADNAWLNSVKSMVQTALGVCSVNHGTFQNEERVDSIERLNNVKDRKALVAEMAFAEAYFLKAFSVYESLNPSVVHNASANEWFVAGHIMMHNTNN